MGKSGNGSRSIPSTGKDVAEIKLKARSVSRGVAIGKAVCLYGRKRQFYRTDIADSAVEREIKRMRAAIRLSKNQLKRMTSANSGRLGESTAGIFEVHRLILDDPSLSEQIEGMIRQGKVNAEWAVKVVTDELIAKYKAIPDEHLRERYIDLEDVADRLLAALGGGSLSNAPLQKDAVIFAKEVKPSTLIELIESQPAAIVTEHGGWTSHTFILAREVDLPAVTGVKNILRQIKPGEDVIVDGFSGQVILRPAADTIRSYTPAAHKPHAHAAALADIDSKLKTLDGREIVVRANVDMPRAYREAKRVGAKGIGLYRSEFLFNQFKGFPSEHEQVEEYRRVAELAGEDGVRIRTFDLSAEQLAETGYRREKNPALGLRAIRLSLSNPKQFRTQIRALLQASYGHRVEIVLPMVSDVSEVIQTREMIERERASLKRRGIPFGTPSLGSMIEVPAAVFTVNEIAEESDFLCLGTNDLVQYTLAVDRDNESVSEWFRSLHPAVVRAIAQVIRVADDYGKPIVVCGEMAGSPYYVPVLIGLGATELSMNAHSIPRVRKVIAGIAYEEAYELAREVERCRSAGHAEDLLASAAREKWHHLFPPEVLAARS